MNTENSLIFHWATALFGGKHFCKGSGQMLTVQQEMCCSCGGINCCDRLCSVHKGGQNQQLCPAAPVSHSCKRMSALTSLSDPGSSAPLAAPCAVVQAE